jgi:hypothetical protein
VNYFFMTLLALTTSYAFWAGGGPERVGTAVYALSVPVTHLALLASNQHWRNLEIGVLIVDATTFVIFVLIALRADRFWPIWVSALLGIALLGHLARFVTPDTYWRAYAKVLVMWSYPILALMVLGTFLHWKRLKLYGADRSWTTSSGRSGPAAPAGPTAS